MPDDPRAAVGLTASPAMAAMAALLDELVVAGLQHIVLCPGSRSQALALLTADLERSGRVRLHVRVDERSAGFLALGIGRESGRPAAVIVTSGTAVGNLLPATMEAHHAGVPMLLLTADRPDELRGVGANQATTQPGMFSSFVRFETDADVPTDAADTEPYRELARTAWHAAVGFPAGAVHLNLPVREPLAGAFPDWWSPLAGTGGRTATGQKGADDVIAPSGLAAHAASAFPAVAGGPGVAGASAAPARAGLAAHAASAVPAVAGASAVPGVAGAPGMAGASAAPAVAGASAAADACAAPAVAGASPVPRVAGASAVVDPSVSGRAPAGPADEPLGWDRPAPTVLVAGADAGPEAAALAEDRGWPLIAEIVSGARLGSNVVPAYRIALRAAELVDTIQRVAVIGHPTLSREVARLLARTDVDVVAVPATGERLNLNGRTRATSIAALYEAAHGDDDWCDRWLQTPAAETAAAGITRAALVRAVWHASEQTDRVLFGSSRLVRVADDVLEPRAVRVHANRGLAGIDGTIATAIGIDAAAERGITRVILGDLTLLHDAGSLLVPADEPDPRVQLVVGNDGGGTIFDTLEVAGVASPEAFRRVQYTPQQVDFAALARAYGWDHVRVTSVEHLAEALDTQHTRRIIEVPLDR